MYELILMDFYMNGKTGLEVSKDIRGYLAANLPEANGSRPYITLVTSAEVSSIQDKIKKSGIN